MASADGIRVNRENVARLRLERQGLLPAGRREEPERDAAGVIGRLGQVQCDPLNLVSRAEHLVLHSRVPGYRHADLDGLYAPEAKVFEYWTRAASILPMELYPLVAPAMRVRRTDHYWPKWVGWWLGEHADVARRILKEIEAQGPMRARDFAGEERRRGGWGRSKVTTEGLKALRAAGELMVAGRQAGEQVHDLTERVLPKGVKAEDVEDEERIGRLLRVAARSYGACDVDELARLWGAVVWTPEGKLSGKDVRDNAEAYGLELFRVTGSERQWACLPGDIEGLRDADADGEPNGVSLLCPFDNVLWDRRMVAELFGFEYRLEAYVPAAKREFGAYVMPILWGERLVGRLDPKLDRKKALLTINGVWLEDRRAAPAGLVAGLADALAGLAEFVGATDIKIAKTRPAALKAALAKRM